MTYVRPLSYQDKFAKCPYFKKQDRCTIVCEGINNESSTHIVFGDLKAKAEYTQKYCNDIGGCRKCPLHNTLDRKYGDED